MLTGLNAECLKVELVCAKTTFWFPTVNEFYVGMTEHLIFKVRAQEFQAGQVSYFKLGRAELPKSFTGQWPLGLYCHAI